MKSWLGQENIPVLPVRYEDMLTSPVETFGRAVAFAGIPTPPHRIESALARSRFESLKHQEAEQGFREKAQDCPVFFNRGKAGYWRDFLSREQVDIICRHHGETMVRFGYLDTDGSPV